MNFGHSFATQLKIRSANYYFELLKQSEFICFHAIVAIGAIIKMR